MSHFISGGEHTVIDTKNRLMWTRSDSMNDMEKWVNYQESVDYARDLCEKQFAGFDNWRLPTREEMGALYNESFSIRDKFEKEIHISDCFSPATIARICPDTLVVLAYPVNSVVKFSCANFV